MPTFPAKLLNLGQFPYMETLALMRRLAVLGRSPEQPQVVIVVTHEPVITMGRRAESSEVRADPTRLRRLGVNVHRIERGGLATYHGPGQLVAYTIFNLRTLRMGIKDLVAALEAVIVDTLDEFGVAGRLREGYRGVWVGAEKIASIGLAVKHQVTFHGLALNCDPDLSHFDLITPCGLTDVCMTSMARQLGRPVSVTSVTPGLAASMARRLRLSFNDWSPAEAQAAAERVPVV